jgi:hypothetical protein
VVSRPSSTTASPQAAFSIQAGWLAAAKPWRNGPYSPTARIAPLSDGPRECPACRPAELMPPATPAWAMGMPATAAANTTVFTAPYPMPKTMKAGASSILDGTGGA